MPTLPQRDDVTKQANQVIEEARTPLLAVLGAGDIAAHAVVDTVTKVRTQLNERAEAARSDLNDLGKVDTDQLRNRVDGYAASAKQVYGYLAERGEDALGRLRTQPGVQQAWSQVEQAQDRVENAVGDAREVADDVLGRVTRATRSGGEKAAEATEKAVDDVAETVEQTAEDTAQTVKDAGADAAATTRSKARKTANKTEAAKSTTTKTSSAKSKPEPKSAARKSTSS
ncbi:hypothetical protein GIY23_21120 [Allosaccharopolyspora coralli]|uniref:Heparin-binding hemagglutinin n=1 Tax=Allosaccharopolyspora coralli TaxID=2665642 RepID=A0A5Q3QE88_9PSEU|nr:hypothetical protein [Allosaccharopolyspora coralli]QGK71686.1 hypothetical protein GIY23_21120 [Allosaccharopolyspora coralli]